MKFDKKEAMIWVGSFLFGMATTMAGMYVYNQLPKWTASIPKFGKKPAEHVVTPPAATT